MAFCYEWLTSFTSKPLNSPIPYIAGFLIKCSQSILQPAVLLYLYNSTCQNLVTHLTVKEAPSNSSSTPMNSTEHQMAQEIWTELDIHFTCSNLSVPAQNIIQSNTANYIMLATILHAVPAFIMSLFCIGGWIDRIGFRIPIVVSTIGGILVMLFIILTSIYQIAPLAVIFTAVTVLSMFGPIEIVNSVIQAYVGSTTTIENRTCRLGFLIAAGFVGNIVGSLILAGVVETLPFWSLWAFVGVFFLAVLIIIPACLPQDADKTSDEFNDEPSENTVVLKKVVSIVHLDNISNTSWTVFRERPNNMRTYLFVTLAAVCLVMASQGAEMTVIYLFTKHAPLNWTDSDFGYLLTFQNAINATMILIVIPLLVKLLKMTDGIIIVAFAIPKAFGLCCFSLATNDWMVYIGVIYLAVFGVVTSCLRSIVSKILDPEEQGRCFNIFAAFEVLSVSLGSLFFSQIYSECLTLGTSIGRSIPFMIMAVFYIIAAVLAFYVDYHLDLSRTVDESSITAKTDDGYEPLEATSSSVPPSTPDVADSNRIFQANDLSR